MKNKGLHNPESYLASIIVPAFNEEEGIDRVIKELISLDGSYELIIINDGSTDRTAEIAGDHPEVRLITHDRNLGYGTSLRTGIRNSSSDIVIITDADNTYPNDKIDEITDLLKQENLDMVVGSRTSKHVKIPLIRRPAKWCINKLANYLSGTAIPDLNSGLRAMKKEVVERFIRILPNGFSFTTTITLAMLTNNYNVKYIPINYAQRKGRSKIRPIRDTLNFIQLVIRTVMYFNPLKIFVPLSLLLVIFAFILLAVSWIYMSKPMDVSFGVVLMTAVIVLTVGMLADLIDKRT